MNSAVTPEFYGACAVQMSSPLLLFAFTSSSFRL